MSAWKHTIQLIFQQRLDAVILIHHPPAFHKTQVKLETKPNPTQGRTKARGQSAGQMPKRGKTGNVSAVEKCEGVFVSSVAKEADAFHRGRVNRTERLKGAYPGITHLDQLFRVNQLYIKNAHSSHTL